MDDKSLNQIKADEMIAGSGGELPTPNCFECVNRKEIDSQYSSCHCAPTEIIRMLYEMGHISEVDLPIIPLTSLGIVEKDENGVPDKDTLEVSQAIETLIPHESGLNSGKFKWPIKFMPEYVLMCLYFARKEDIEPKQLQQNDTNSDIDNSTLVN